jgi:hypothetical protein
MRGVNRVEFEEFAPEVNPAKKSVRPYYEDMGAGCDWIVRCKDCRTLRTAAQVEKLGSCICGNRKVVEVRTLSEQEMADIQSGKIDFPHRDKFLAEFAAVDVE